MSETSPQTLDPKAVEKMPMTVAIAFALTTVLIAGMLALVNQRDWWRGFLPAAVVSAIATIVSVLLMRSGLKKELTKAVASYFAGAGARFVVSLAACFVAVKIGGYPPVPTMMLMMVFYVAILIVEVKLMVNALSHVNGQVADSSEARQ